MMRAFLLPLTVILALATGLGLLGVAATLTQARSWSLAPR